MSLLGKILAVLNVLAAGLFVYLAAADWGKRQTWTYAVYRFQLAIDGLPLDADAKGVDGKPLVDNLTDRTVQDVFKPVGGVSGPVQTPEDKTQVGEVKRVEAALRKDIEAAPNDEAKRAKIFNILVYQQRTEGEREEMAAQVLQGKIDTLMSPTGPFEQLFGQVVSGGKEHAADERRQAIAHLLFNINSVPKVLELPALFNLGETEWHERVQVVVGLKTFITEVNHQAAALHTMYDQVHLTMDRDRDFFEKEHRRVLGDLRVLEQNQADRDAELDKQKSLAERHGTLVTTRKTELAELKMQVDKSRQSAQAALLELARYQKRLFDAQKNVGSRLNKNRDLEREIRELEGVK